MKLQRFHDRLTELQGSRRGGAKMCGGVTLDTETQSFQVVLGMGGQKTPIYYVGDQGGVHTFTTVNPAAAASYPAGMKVAYVR